MAKLDLFNHRAIAQLKADIAALKAQSSTIPGWAGAYADAHSMTLPDPSMYENQAELFARLAWVNIAVSFKANALASQPLSVYKDEGEDTEAISNHDFEKLLKHPNPGLSRFELLFNTGAYYSLCGNAYWWLNKGNENAAPDEIWVIPPGQIQPVPDGKLWIKGYWYFPGDGSQIFLEPWEIVHFHGFHPKDQFLGMSNVEPIAVDAQADLAAAKWNAKFFRDSNGKLPSVLAFADNIPDADWEQLKKNVDENANKRQMMMLRNVKAGGIQWIQATASQKDMEFLSGRTFTKEEIYNIFAPGLVSILALNATEANSKTGKATFAEYSLWPMCVVIHEKITTSIMPAYGENLLAQFDDPRQSDRVLELQEMAEYSKTHTVDEVRAKYWDDEPLSDVTEIESDERGILFPAQISPTTPVPSDEEPEPNPVTTTPPIMPGNETITPVLEEPVEPVAPEMSADDEPYVEGKELRAELKKWRAKCLYFLKHGTGEKRNAAAEFVSVSIPLDMYASIMARLETATTEDEVKAIFRSPIVTQTPVVTQSDTAAILEMGAMALEGMKVAFANESKAD